MMNKVQNCCTSQKINQVKNMEVQEHESTTKNRGNKDKKVHQSRKETVLENQTIRRELSQEQ